ncbi:MAG TPA: hypothetical protein VHZ55_24430 [Bryobacteraceae bacterium]|nr:hypothetical protein [Bryobacteraceae bacterium]
MRKVILTACLAAPLFLAPAANVCAQAATVQPQSGPMPNPPPPPTPPPLQGDVTQSGAVSVLVNVFHIILGM